MKMKLRSRLSLLFLSFALVLGLPAMALADVVTVSDANTLQASGDTTKQSGQTGTARFHLLASDNKTDPVNNCNADANNKVKVTVEQSAKNASGQSISSPVNFASPGYVELEGCDDSSTANTIEFAKTLGYTVGSSAQVGDVITVTGKASGGRTLGNGSTGAFSNDTFKITVVAPPEQGTALSVSAASGIYGGDADLSAKLSSGSTNLAGKQVDFELNGVSVGSAITGTDGVAKKTVSLGSIGAGGPYVDAVSASYAGTGSQCSTGCYGPSDGKAALTVDKADLTVSTDNKSKTYGDANPSFTGAITGLKNSDDITASRASEATSSSAVGNYPITATLSDPGNKLSNYSVTNNGGMLTVDKRAITVTADAQSKTYGQNDPNLTHKVTSGSLVGADGFSGNLSREAGENVGSYAIGQGSLSAGANYELRYVGADLTIGAKQLSGSFTAENKTYDGNNGVTITSRELSGVVGNDDVSLSGGTASFADENVGTAKTVTGSGFGLSGAQAGNYSLSMNNTTTANITSKPLTGGFTANDKVYDGTTAATIKGSTLDGAIDGDEVSLAGDEASFADENVGNGKTVTVTRGDLSGADARNYSLASGPWTTTADITQKALTGGFTASDKVYDGTRAATVASRSLPGVIGTDAVTLDVSNAQFDAKNVGTGKDVTGSLSLTGADAANYSVNASHTAKANITAKVLTGSINAQDKTYDGNTGANASAQQLVGVIGQEQVGLQVSSARFDSKNVGNRTVTADLALSGADAGNYSLHSNTASAPASITAKSITGSFTASNKVYDGGDSATITSSSLGSGKVENDDLSLDSSVATAKFDNKNVGNRTVTGYGFVLSGADANNYSLTMNTTTAGITARPITVTADAQSKTYGDHDPALTYQVTEGNLVQGDAFTGNLDREAGQDVGSYAINRGNLSAGDNYNLSFNGANLTIAKRSITVNADPQTKVYGDADPALTYRIGGRGLALGDSLSGDLQRATGETVAGGPYAIEQGNLSASNNYELTYNGANLTITARPITVKADSKSKVYGQDDPALTYGIARGNLVGNDTLSGGLQRAAGENVGDYAIRQGNLSASNNYNLGFVEGTLTITARPITITADAKSKLFGDADPALTYQVTRGSLVQGDSFSGNLTRDTGESVGAYPIRQGNVSAGNNYDLTYNGANLTIGTWSLKGFHAPVDMLDGTGNIMVNTVKGGSTVPMKFEVFKGATELKDVSAIKSTTYLKSTACNGAYADEIEVVLTGNTSLRFDATSDQFVYNWKTPTGAGCYKSIVTTQDGSQLIAYFKTR